MARDQEERSQWRLNKELSIGDLLAIVIALVSVFSAYHTLDVRISIIEREFIQAQQTDAEVKEALKGINAKLDRLFEERRK